jgi:hypothetical protein
MKHQKLVFQRKLIIKIIFNINQRPSSQHHYSFVSMAPAKRKASPKKKAKTSPIAGQDAMEIDNKPGEGKMIEVSEAAAIPFRPKPGRDADATRRDEESAETSSSSDEEGSIDFDQEIQSDDSYLPTSLRQLRDALSDGTERFLFACSGQIPSRQNDQDLAHFDPVTVRWDPQDDQVSSSRCKLRFPLDANAEESITQLLGDMEPAIFGRGGEDVNDENYGKTLELDPSRFSTNFCPYQKGIVDIIARLLLPRYPFKFIDAQTVRAELYKLNVSSSYVDFDLINPYFAGVPDLRAFKPFPFSYGYASLHFPVWISRRLLARRAFRG